MEHTYIAEHLSDSLHPSAITRQEKTKVYNEQDKYTMKLLLVTIDKCYDMNKIYI